MTNSGRMSGRCVLGILLALPTQPWDYGHTMSRSDFYVCVENLNLGPHAFVTKPLAELPPSLSSSVCPYPGLLGPMAVCLLGFHVFSADRKTQATCNLWFLFCEPQSVDFLQLSQFLESCAWVSLPLLTRSHPSGCRCPDCCFCSGSASGHLETTFFSLWCPWLPVRHTSWN